MAGLADGAILDTRVLLAHRLGVDERSWPCAEDRFRSDLLLPDAITDGWLAALTRSAAAAPVPILLGAHTLVGPGIRVILDDLSGTSGADRARAAGSARSEAAAALEWRPVGGPRSLTPIDSMRTATEVPG